MYIFKENMLCLYIKYIYKLNYMNINKYMWIFLNIYCMGVYLYIHNKYTQYTHMYYVNKNFYLGCD